MSAAVKQAVLDVIANTPRFKRVEYGLNESEYLRAVFLLPQTKRAMRIVVLVAAALALVAVWMYTQGASGLALAFGVLATLYPFIVRHIFTRIYRRAYRTMQLGAGTEVELVYGDGFIAQSTASSFSYLTSLYQLRFTRQFRLLGLSSQLYVIVPIRVFDSHTTLTEFDAITGSLAQGRVIGK